jgi:hypothetical protein
MTQEYVGIDLHRRRSVIYRMDEAGEKIDSIRVDNEPSRFAKEVSRAPVGSDVIVEATYGWVRHEAPHDRVGGRAPPATCRSRSLKLGAA